VPPELMTVAVGRRTVEPRFRVDALARELGGRLEQNWYAGAGHGLRSSFRQTPAGKAAWQSTLGFLSAHLAQPGAA
jgi:hypothetical protein